MNNIKARLIVMNFLQFAIWGAYLTCIGQFLGKAGLGDYVPWFYIAQGVVSIFMPAVMGALADKFIQPQRLLGISHLLAAGFMLVAAYFGYRAADVAAANAAVEGFRGDIWPVFIPYVLSVAFYMPTIALSNTVAFTTLSRSGRDFVKAFPPIRTCGTVGFIAAMWAGVRPYGQRPVHLHAAGRMRRAGTSARRLLLHAARVSARLLGRQAVEDAGAAPGTGCVRAVQAAQNGDVLHILDAVGRLVADYQRLCDAIYRRRAAFC